MKIAIFIAALVVLVLCETDRPCEDAPIDCAQKDLDMEICKDPIDSAAYCPRYCGKCQGPTPVPNCRDFDKFCFELANSEYCKKDIARQLCAQSCGLCAPPTTTTTTTTTTTEAPTTTTEEPTTTPQRFTEIQDPACQDVDPHCITLLQRHYCSEEVIVRKLCQRSCSLCPTVLVPVTGGPGSVMTTSKQGVSTQMPTEGSSTERVCQDFDPTCAEPSTADNCTANYLLQRLCPLACGVCVPAPTEMGETTPGVPKLNPFTPGSSCYDNDPDCPVLIQAHNCSADQIVMRLCPVSCNLCQSATTPSTGVTGVPVECKDYSEDCDQLQPSCVFDPLVVRLCRKTCNAAPCASEATTIGATEPPTPSPTPAFLVTSAVPAVTDNGMTTDNDVITTPDDVITTPDDAITTPVDVITTAADVITPVDGVITTNDDVSSNKPDAMTSGVPATAEPASTKNPFPSLNPATLSPECFDRDSQCSSLVNNFYCGTNDLLRRICPSSCNLCTSTTPSGAQVTTPGSGECADFDPQCPTLKNFCQREDLLVNRLCRKSCGLCGIDIVVPPKQDPLPLTCRVCVDPFCEREVESVMKCPDESPYCGSRVINNADGTHGLTKRCASKADCDNGYAGTAAGNETMCSSFDPNVIVQDPFICFFCCRTNECNKHAKPDADTLYTPN